MTVLDVKKVGKAYRGYKSELHRILSWFGFSMQPVNEHWVVRDMSFSVSSGEAVGIIGQNGAGKSSLLKLITGTQKPSEGEIKVYGRISAILELGMGFNPEFTGRQNVHHGLGLMGFSLQEIESSMLDIEGFSDIGEYFDQPVRTYSSGMQMRVAFSVATAFRPDILIVDEALSVGDIEFQQRCYERIKEFQKKGTTLLFVSHSAEAIFSLCERAIWISGGKILSDGDVKTTVDKYQSNVLLTRNEANNEKRNKLQNKSADKQSLSDDGSLVDVRAYLISSYLECENEIVDSVISDSQVCVVLGINFVTKIEEPYVGVQIRNARGGIVFMTNSLALGVELNSIVENSSYNLRISADFCLVQGEYTITVGMASKALGDGTFQEQIFRKQNCIKFTVLKNKNTYDWGGVCNLNASMEWTNVVSND